MYIHCHDADDMVFTIARLVKAGLTFNASTTSLIIELTGGF